MTSTDKLVAIVVSVMFATLAAVVAVSSYSDTHKPVPAAAAGCKP